ncbi:MAG: hypothetical protein HQL36_11070 [Alphaproteobacteria bacterium]|nr:hypothetical protein [Alphaproteobacteria bacterium]MBF0251692.1 hypothetical protein [Alphaproteobacteria bacterium]
MATHVQIAADLLRNAATFFRDIGAQNDDLKDQMEINARTYDSIAALLVQDPMGELPLASDEQGGPDPSSH